MKNKGFTLIEIIAVIVIMGILLVVVFAGTSRLMKSNDEKKYTTYYDIVHEGLEKYARTRRNEVGGSQGSGCFDDKKLEDLIEMGYVKEFTEEDNVYCGTPRDFASIPASWGIDTSKQYASLRVEGENGNITTKLSLICVEVNSNGTYASEPTYVNLIEAGPECISNSVMPDDPEPPTPEPPTPDPNPPGPSTTYYTITYNKNGGSSCTKTTDTKASGEAVDLTPTCTRSGYTFYGWSKTSGGTKLTSLTVEDQDITLYAKWVSNSSSSSTLCSYVTTNNSFPNSDDNLYLIVWRNGSSTLTQWTNEPVNFKIIDSRNNFTYATWNYPGGNNKVVKEERVKFTNVGPNGTDYFTAKFCVYYDSIKPTIEFEDSCTESAYGVVLSTNITIRDGDSTIKNISPSNLQSSCNSDKSICNAKSAQIRWKNINSAKPFTVSACDNAGNCTEATYTTKNIALSETECP